MKISALIFASLLPVLAPTAYGLENGLYVISDTPTQFPMTTVDQRKIYLGAKFSDETVKATLRSTSNDNSRYDLEIACTGQFVALDHLCLFLNGHCAQFYGLGRDSASGESSTETYLSAGSFVSDAVAYFKIVPQDRHHPGHLFVGSFTVRSKEYPLAGPIAVTFKLINCGPQPFNYESWGFLGHKFDGWPSPEFTFSAHAQGSNIPVQNLPNHFNEMPMGMIIPGGVLKPGESRSVVVDLKDYLGFEKPGIYTIRGTCAFRVRKFQEESGLPWDDFATAEFQVTIK